MFLAGTKVEAETEANAEAEAEANAEAGWPPALLEEQVLAGGNVNRVVRVGDTVRRNAGPYTTTIHRLLSHVRAKGLTWVPEPRGFDELGREVLSFLAGEVPHEMPTWVWSGSVLKDVSRALRQWHDATLGFSVHDATWGLPPRARAEVICHNDFAPYNCVFRDGRFAGAIDFDCCAPGPRIWDIAYTVYRFVPLTPAPSPDAAPGAAEVSRFAHSVLAERLRVFLETYGLGDRSLTYDTAEVLRVTADRLEALAGWTEEHARATGAMTLKRHAAMYREHAHWVRAWHQAG